MSNDVFPSLPGLKWSVKRVPQWTTTVQVGRTGREVRLQEQDAPIWHWELGYEIVSDDRTSGMSDLQKLLGFYLARKGAWDSFLYTDADDYTVTDEPIGTGTRSEERRVGKECRYRAVAGQTGKNNYTEYSCENKR